MVLAVLVGFDAAGEPLLGPRITGNEAANAPGLEVVRRLGLASPVILCLPPAVLAAPPTEAISELLCEASCIVGPFRLENADDARAWLDAGAKQALFVQPDSSEQPLASTVKDAAAQVGIPGERLMLLVSVPLEPAHPPGLVDRLVADITSLAAPNGVGCYECCKPETVGIVSGILLVMPRGFHGEGELLNKLGPLAASDRLQVFLGGLASQSAASIGQLHQPYMLHVVGTASLADTRHFPHPLPPPPALAQGAAALGALFADPPVELGPCIAACVRTDRSDGLFPTLVVEADGAALGLVYSSAASIAAALSCGRGVYWSRSRQALWRKGDTSGAWQTLRRIRLDCDGDALAFTVTQHGNPPAFCHKSTLSCWGAPTGLQHLQVILRQRKASAPPGSYTKRLFDDADLLRNKLVEEAQELAEATEPDHVAAEAADLFFFAMTRCVAAGVGLADVQSHLDRRALKLGRRPGNAKADRIAAGDAILKAKTSEGGQVGGRSAKQQWMPIAAMLAALVVVVASRR